MADRFVDRARRLRANSLLGLLSAAGCAEERIFAVSELMTEDTQFVGLSVLRDGVPRTSTGLVDREAAKELSIEIGEGDELELYGYREVTLSKVGAPGEDELSKQPLVFSEHGPALPFPDVQLEGFVLGGTIALEPSGLSRRLSAAWCAALDPCAYWSLDVTEFPLEIASIQLRSLERWSEHEVLILTTDGELGLFDLELGEVRHIASLTPELRAEALFARGPRDVFGVGMNHQFVHAGPELEFRAEAASFPVAGVTNLDLDGSTRGPTELFAVVDGRAFLQYRDGIWSVLYESASTAIDGGRVRWIAPGRAVATLEGEGSVLVYDSGQIVRFTLPGGLPPKALAHVEGIGTLIGTHQGRIYRVADRGVELYLELASSLERITHAVAFEDGFVFLLGGNLIGAYHERYGTCAPQLLSPPNKYGQPISVGDGLVAVARPSDELPSALVRLERGAKPSPRCFLK